MDSAYLLKQKCLIGEKLNEKDILNHLNNSELIKYLLVDFEFDVISLLNRLTQLSEIPFTYKIPKVQQWVNKLVAESSFDKGFSYTGQANEMLSCYNSMITSILIKMNYDNKHEIEKGINWILTYQNFERGGTNRWKGKSIMKYGGCLKSTPCYVGVVKALNALSDYKNSKYYNPNPILEEKLAEGLEYLLKHNLYQRISNTKPITNYILKLTYPFSYKINIIELLRLLKANGLMNDKRCLPAIEYLKKRRKTHGFWQVNSLPMPKGWVHFDKVKEPGKWISQEVEELLRG